MQINKIGPASKTEIKEGDIITTIDGNEINTMNELREYIRPQLFLCYLKFHKFSLFPYTYLHTKINLISVYDN